MQKPELPRTKRLFAALFNVKSWLDVDRIRAGFRFISEQGRQYFIPNSKKQVESFDAAMTRLGLSEEDIVVRQRGLLRLSIMMVFAAIAVFLYLLYNLAHRYYVAVALSTIVMLLALTLAFRYHFWYFQMKQRRLGCSLREWFGQGLMGVGDE